jgi:hypothetical protein
MPQKNKTNNSKKNLQSYRTRTQTQTQTQPTITHARFSVVSRPEQDPPHRARITAGGDRIHSDRIRTILDTGATAHFIEPRAHE